MTAVRYPAMRREVLVALAALADPDFQQTMWVRKEYPRPNFLSNLDTVVHVLYDDCQVLPDPTAGMGTVLVDGDELAHLQRLGELFDALLNDHVDQPDSVYLQDPRWPTLVDLATKALTSMIRSWGFDFT
jgi:hypothetical protein